MHRATAGQVRSSARGGSWPPRHRPPIVDQRLILTTWSRSESRPTTQSRTKILFSNPFVPYRFPSPRATMPTAPPHVLTDLRSRIARIARDPARRRAPAIRFGIAALDRHLPDGGLAIGALHEAAGAGPDTEHAAAAALFAAGALARLRGPVLWALPRWPASDCTRTG